MRDPRPLQRGHTAHNDRSAAPHVVLGTTRSNLRNFLLISQNVALINLLIAGLPLTQPLCEQTMQPTTAATGLTTGFEDAQQTHREWPQPKKVSMANVFPLRPRLTKDNMHTPAGQHCSHCCSKHISQLQNVRDQTCTSTELSGFIHDSRAYHASLCSRILKAPTEHIKHSLSITTDAVAMLIIICFKLLCAGPSAMFLLLASRPALLYSSRNLYYIHVLTS